MEDQGALSSSLLRCRLIADRNNNTPNWPDRSCSSNGTPPFQASRGNGHRVGHGLLRGVYESYKTSNFDEKSCQIIAKLCSLREHNFLFNSVHPAK